MKIFILKGGDKGERDNEKGSSFQGSRSRFFIAPWNPFFSFIFKSFPITLWVFTQTQICIFWFEPMKHTTKKTFYDCLCVRKRDPRVLSFSIIYPTLINNIFFSSYFLLFEYDKRKKFFGWYASDFYMYRKSIYLMSS